jgi:hypothetical protein
LKSIIHTGRNCGISHNLAHSLFLPGYLSCIEDAACDVSVKKEFLDRNSQEETAFDIQILTDKKYAKILSFF